MASCPNGASVKPGVDPNAEIIIDRATWATMVGASSSWFDEWLAFLQPKVVKVSDLVALNPDDPPLPSVAELIAAVDPPYLGIPAVLNYMFAKLTYYEFTQFAVCNGTTGMTGCDPTNPVTGAATSYAGPVPSFTFGGKFSARQAGTELRHVTIGNQVTPFHGNSHIYVWSAAGALLQSTAFTFPGSGSTYTVTLSSAVPLTSGTTYWIGVDLNGGYTWGYWTAGQWVDNTMVHVLGGGDGGSGSVGVFPINQYATWYGFWPVVCSTTAPPPPPTQPTKPDIIVIPPSLSCGTTADLCTAVRQLDQRLTQIYSLLTIVQRHGVPFAYVPGAVHSGLTGTGSFPISGLLGLRVQLAEEHEGQPVLPGNPPYLWNQGWLSVNDANGMLEEKRLTRTGLEWFPKFCQTATSFNWAVADGVVMVVTELEAET